MLPTAAKDFQQNYEEQRCQFFIKKSSPSTFYFYSSNGSLWGEFRHEV
jgi:hypothetical protein